MSIKGWAARWLTVRGRASRREFITLFVCFILVNMAIAVALPAASRPYIPIGDRSERGPWPGIILRLIVLWPWIAANGRRLHDRGKSAAWAAIIWVPPLNMIFGAIPRGDPLPNQYGPPPGKTGSSSSPSAARAL